MSKPKVIIEKAVPGAVQLLVRIDRIEQVDMLVHYLEEWLTDENASAVSESWRCMFTFDKKNVFSGRLFKDRRTVDYLVVDEGSTLHVASIFLVFQGEESALARLLDRTDERFFEL